MAMEPEDGSHVSASAGHPLLNHGPQLGVALLRALLLALATPQPMRYDRADDGPKETAQQTNDDRDDDAFHHVGLYRQPPLRVALTPCSRSSRITSLGQSKGVSRDSEVLPLNTEQAEIVRVIATGGVVLAGVLVGVLGIVFALYLDRASPDERGQRPAILRPLRVTGWVLVGLSLFVAAAVGTSIWWFSDPNMMPYNVVLGLFLTQMLAIPVILGAAVWYWLS